MRVWGRVGRWSSTAKFFSPKLRPYGLPDAATRLELQKLPKEYQKFYNEWQEDGTPVHWIPSSANYKRNPETGEVKIIQDRPIPVVYPHQSHLGIWGGEGVIDGLVKKGKFRSPVPKFWVPSLHRSVVYSEILDKYFSVVVTVKALRLIDEFHGLDSYLLKNTANDLKSLLALKLKRKLLQALAMRDFARNDPQKQLCILEKYKDFIIPIQEVEWYGLSVEEAKAKLHGVIAQEKLKRIMPLKSRYRMELIEKLKAEATHPPPPPLEELTSKSWLQKLNPFSKPKNAPNI